MAVLEVIATSVEDAVAAERGGAGRLEVVRDLDRDGLTPSLDMVREMMRAVRIPLRVMVRERATFTVDSPGELRTMADAARAFAALGVDGVVCGFIADGGLDLTALDVVIEAAAPVRVTIHRALETATSVPDALQQLARYPRVDRVLIAGGPGGWAQRLRQLQDWTRACPPGVALLPGSGIDADALRVLGSVPTFAEAHVGRAVREPATTAGTVSSAKVAALLAVWNEARLTPDAGRGTPS